ncbi:Hypothetical protein FKW44_020640, partial [Caligus rogercresseyi]
MVLDGKANQVGMNQRVPNQIISDWVHKFEMASVEDARTPKMVNKVDHAMEAPISVEEIGIAMKDMGSDKDPLGMTGAEIL